MTRQLLFDRIDERVSLDREADDSTYFNALLLKLEYLTKIVVSGMIACIEDDADRRRYSLEYELVRANSIGTWIKMLSEALSSKRFIPEARGLARDLTERVSPGDWRHAAVDDLNRATRAIGAETDDIKGKIALKRFFEIGVQLRNSSIRGHGATTAVQFSRSCPNLDSALAAVTQNLEIFRLPWAYLHRNLSGRYRVWPLLNERSSFDYLKETRDVRLPNGVFFRLNDQAPTIHVPLIFFDSDSIDIALPNGNYNLKAKTFETLSYVTNNKPSQDGAAWFKAPESIPAKSASLEQAETSLLRLTEEQYARLDELEENERCLFKGAAGTGKTLLALEYARRAGRAGSKVLLICFNNLLGKWLGQQTESMEGVTAGAWHKIARKIIMGGEFAKEFREKELKILKQNTGWDELYDDLYPLYYGQSISEPPFDVLVVDEAQDLIKQSVLGCFDLTVRGGLARGRWAMFGDFTQQAIYGKAGDLDTDLSRYCKHLTKAKLALNCRNTQPIADAISSVTGFEKPPFILSKETGLPVEYIYWKTPADLVASLENQVDRLTKENIPIQNIVLLSPYSLKKSNLAGVERISGFSLVDISRGKASGRAKDLKFSTIHSFKGLESQVAIIVDIDAMYGHNPQSVLYVGMSRARSHLILMVKESARKRFESGFRQPRDDIRRSEKR